MEGLGLIELLTVQSANHVSVSVLFSSPERSVPQLAICRVPRSQFVALKRRNPESLGVVELNTSVAIPPVVLGK